MGSDTRHTDGIDNGRPGRETQHNKEKDQILGESEEEIIIKGSTEY